MERIIDQVDPRKLEKEDWVDILRQIDIPPSWHPYSLNNSGVRLLALSTQKIDPTRYKEFLGDLSWDLVVSNSRWVGESEVVTVLLDYLRNKEAEKFTYLISKNRLSGRSIRILFEEVMKLEPVVTRDVFLQPIFDSQELEGSFLKEKIRDVIRGGLVANSVIVCLIRKQRHILEIKKELEAYVYGSDYLGDAFKDRLRIESLKGDQVRPWILSFHNLSRDGTILDGNVSEIQSLREFGSVNSSIDKTEHYKVYYRDSDFIVPGRYVGSRRPLKIEEIKGGLWRDHNS